MVEKTISVIINKSMKVMSAHIPQISSKDRFKALVVINLFVCIFVVFNLPQCSKCRKCAQQCEAYYRDSSRTIVDTMCARNFNSDKEYQDSILKIKTAGYIINEPEFSECSASSSQLKGATCF
jgi:hypothetical protein